MPRETVHIVQAYVAGRGKGLKTEQQVGCKDAADAARKAEGLAPNHEGVIAYSVSADIEIGDYYENPVVLFAATIAFAGVAAAVTPVAAAPVVSAAS